jgi:hypothetical protein
MTIKLGDRLVVPGDIDPKDLKAKCETLLLEIQQQAGAIPPQSDIRYKGYRVFYTYDHNSQVAQITQIQ